MKNFRKYMFLFLLLCGLLILPGCDGLEELRNKQACFSEGNNNIILYKDQAYRLIDSGSLFYERLDSDMDFAGQSAEINVTASDVPVLLSGFLGYPGTAYVDKGVIIYNYQLYVTDEKRDALVETLRNIELNYYGVRSESISSGLQEQLLSDKQLEIIEELKADEQYAYTPENERSVDYIYENITDPAYLTLTQTDQELFLFRDIATIVFPQGKDSKEAVISYYQIYDDISYLIIPEEYIDVFTELIPENYSNTVEMF